MPKNSRRTRKQHPAAAPPRDGKPGQTRAGGKISKGPHSPAAMSDNKRPQADGEAVVQAQPTGENLEKVRDILFGAQMRDHDKRFVRLEERIAREAESLRDETRKRLDSLEGYIKKEVQTLMERGKSEQNQRTEADKELAQEIKTNTKALEKHLGELDERAAEAERGLRQELLDQSKTLRDEIHQAIQQLSAAVQRGVEELRHDKTDRSALADLFTEMAMRLNELDGSGT